MAVSKYSTLTTPVTVTAKDYGRASDSFLRKTGSLVSGVIAITVGTTVPVATWKVIGEITTDRPSKSVTVPCSDSWNANYAGLLQITTSGNIRIHTVVEIPHDPSNPSNDHSIVATVNYPV